MEDKNVTNNVIKKYDYSNEEILDCTKEIEEYMKEVLPQ